MRIGIDLRSLEDGAQHRGIGRYATQLIEALSQIDHKNEYMFFASHSQAKVPIFKLHELFNKFDRAGRKPGLRKKRIIRFFYLRPKPLNIDKYDLDVFFHIDIQQPIIAKVTPVVPVLFDLIPYIYRDIYQYVPFFGWKHGQVLAYAKLKLRWRLAELTLKNYEKSAAIVSISEHSKRDLLELFPKINPDKIHAIPLAAGNPPHSSEGAAKKFKPLRLKDYLFYVGGADPRKGLVNLVKTMERVWTKHPYTQLVLAGKEVMDMDVPEARNLRDAVNKSSRPNQVFRMGFISDSELAWLYNNARAFVFPSIYEGFGLPILEAMQSGCPVIAYDNSSIPEVAGNAAILIKDGEDMAPAINKLLGDPNLHDKLVKSGYKQEANFTWEKTAKATLAVLESAGRKTI